MLAVQRPRMGSSQEQNIDLSHTCRSGALAAVYGDCCCRIPLSTLAAVERTRRPRRSLTRRPDSQAHGSVSSMASTRAPNPAGAPLLSDNESRLITSFFDTVQSDEYTNYGEGLNFSDAWYDLPPQFMGTATSFGQQPSAPLIVPSDSIHGFPIDLNFSNPSVLMLPPSQPSLQHSQPTHVSPAHTPPLRETPSEDVLAAATLLQTAPGSGRLPPGALFSHEQRYYPSGSMAPPSMAHGRQQSIHGYTADAHSGAGQDPRDDEHAHTISDMVFGSSMQGSTTRLSAPPVDMRWGSDLSFSGTQNFIPRSERDTSESMSREQMKLLDSLEVSASAGNTRPPSPVMANGQASPAAGPSRRISGQSETANGTSAAAKPRRRRKTVTSEDAAENYEEDAAPEGSQKAAASRKRASTQSAVRQENEAQAPAPKRRRKSTNAAGTKPPRENLTEEQKRENHIRSEQKRRGYIKESFENLCLLVPGLDGSGFSKSAVLQLSGDYLQKLLGEIDQLRQELGED